MILGTKYKLLYINIDYIFPKTDNILNQILFWMLKYAEYYYCVGYWLDEMK